jgi:hypothetical protein
VDFWDQFIWILIFFGYRVTFKRHDFARLLSFAASQHSRPEGVDRGLD